MTAHLSRHGTVEELLENVSFVLTILRLYSKGHWERLTDLSGRKMWPCVLWDSEPRITLLGKASSNLTISKVVSHKRLGGL
jgi:hypothetical protein